jgi:hypothetical protein
MLADNIQSLGGRARAEKLSPEERTSIAQEAATARWSVPKATHPGGLKIGDRTIPVAVLEDGTRVVTQRGVFVGLGRHRNPTLGQSTIDQKPAFLAARNLEPFISNDLRRSWDPIKFRLPKGSGGFGGNVAFGYRAEILPMICHVYEDAERAGKLRENQKHVAKAARILSRSFSKVGIIALVDEATGYQYDRARLALAEILEKFIAKELRDWTKTFPSEFYEQIFRLKNWKFDPKSVKRPQVIGHYTLDIVYKRLAPGVLKELKQKNPKVGGKRKHKLFQWLTGDIGDPKLRSHLDGVLALMRASDSWQQFRQFLKKAFPKYETTELGFEVVTNEKK